MQKIRKEIRQELQKEMDLKMNKMNLKMEAMDLKVKHLLDVVGKKDNTVKKKGFGRGSIGRSGTIKEVCGTKQKSH